VCAKSGLLIADSVFRRIAVRIGEHNVNTDPDCKEIRATGQRVCAAPVQEIAVEEEIPHPQYSKTDRHHYNDIALVRLRNPVQYNGKLQSFPDEYSGPQKSLPLFP